jgi:hypothetical protein
MLLAAVAGWALLPLVILLAASRTGSPKGDFTGAGGIQIADQLQYIAWIRDSGDHGLISNRFDTVADPHLLLHPMWIVSGAIWKLGASLQVAFLLWEPVAALAVFGGFAAYARRHLGGSTGASAAALAGALFYFSPAAYLTDWGGVFEGQRFPSLGMALELFPAGLLWSIFPTAIALGLMPVFLLGAERLLQRERPSLRSAASTAAAGAAVAWLHPWQGLILLTILAGVWAWGRFRRGDAVALAIPAAATAAPLAYYAALTHTGSAWATVSQPSHSPHLGWWLVAALAPPLALAATGVRRPARTPGERMLLLWPPAAIAVYFVLQSSFFYHALAGLSLPLAILAARGLGDLGLRRGAASVLVALLTVPGMAFSVDVLTRDLDGHFLTPDESAAFDHLRSEDRPGAVLARLETGRAVPAYADRNTWVGHATWTPQVETRARRASALIEGRAGPAEAQALVREANVAFVLSDCGAHADLRLALGPLVRGVRRFGCATVYEVDPRG